MLFPLGSKIVFRERYEGNKTRPLKTHVTDRLRELFSNEIIKVDGIEYHVEEINVSCQVRLSKVRIIEEFD
ncbi:hypothetical protein [Paenibacillus elgii]|uniref:hypothetical protein n=1 Tax=Paenibacillus elgii TaxID=189691 RepID=UPI00203EF2B5|nr:hypothetical protein [Paenibacillus elgii]MCM3273065.1 hypothetical protein [Paenibacillus elgii]